MRKTKIVCTLGPSTSTKEQIRELVHEGMDVARLNFSHGTHETHKKLIDILKEIREEMGISLGIMLDTKGPELRVGKMISKEIVAEKGKICVITKDPCEPDQLEIFPFEALAQIKEGCQILFHDGLVAGIVEKVQPEAITLRFTTDGIITSRAGVNVPGETLQLPLLTVEDEEDLIFGFREKIDMVAASFVTHPDHILQIKSLAKKHGLPHVFVIAKIETKKAVENFEAILKVADGVMVARGDLGVELPLATLPQLQKRMIRMCNHHAKPVITATQMLESMLVSPRPTRAEASDVANAIYDGSSAVMLSGETAAGKYPTLAVRYMNQIVREAEDDFGYIEFFEESQRFTQSDIPSSIAIAAVELSYAAAAKAIVVCTNAGRTVRRISRLRPKSTIIALTQSIETYHQMALHWGAVPLLEKEGTKEHNFAMISHLALTKGIVKYGDVVVITSGQPYGTSYSTNTISIDSIGRFLVRAKTCVDSAKIVTGKSIVLDRIKQDETMNLVDTIPIVTEFTKEIAQKCTKAKAIILENHPLDETSIRHLEEFYETTSIPFLYDADGATSLIGNERAVRIHFDLALVFDANSPTKEELYNLPY